MDSIIDQSKELKWQKRNFFARIVIIIVLLYIAGYVMYYHYGYEDPDDQILKDQINNRSFSCKQALYYFAENELKIYDRNNRVQNLNVLNMSDWSINLDSNTSS